jgi:hypothetical protein
MLTRFERLAWTFCLVAGCGVSTFAFSADEQANRMKEECSREAGSKSSESQEKTMRDCSQNRTGELRATGSEGAQRAKIKACDAEAKGMDAKAQPRFLKECYAKEK